MDKPEVLLKNRGGRRVGSGRPRGESVYDLPEPEVLLKNRGGRRVGSGRPRGESVYDLPEPKPLKNPKKPPSVNPNRFPGTLLPTTTRRTVVDAMVRYVAGINISPMIVMLNDMKIRHDAACRSMELYEAETDVDEKKKHLNQAMFESGSAAESALRVAPYVHSKLATVVLKGDADNPLQLNFASLRGLTNDELDQMNRLIVKSANTIDV